MEHLNKFQKILYIWAVLILIASLIHQYVTQDITYQMAAWVIITLVGVFWTHRYYNQGAANQKKLEWTWIILMVALFIGNFVAIYVPGMLNLVMPGIWVQWTVLCAIGYVITGQMTNWPAMKWGGVASLLFVPLFFIPALFPYQAILYGITQAGYLGVLGYMKR